MAVDLVVVIPCKNEAARLPRQLAALNDQTDLEFRVVVSDNGSTDTTAILAANWAAKFTGGIDVVDSSSTPGVAHARNAAICATDEPLILICDGDDRVHPGWVSSFRATLAEYSIATGPLHLKFPDAPERNVIWNSDSVPVSMGYRPYAPGGNLGMRREVFETLDGFDSSMSLGQEDVDFGWRAADHGFQIGHAPGAALDYYQRADLRSLLKQQRRYGKAHVLLYDKHRTAADIPPPALMQAGVRWFWEWLKQLPHKIRAGELQITLGAAVFQASRMYHSLRIGGSPL